MESFGFELYHFEENISLSRWRIVQAHWEQREQMEALCHKESTLLCQQPEMVRTSQTCCHLLL